MKNYLIRSANDAHTLRCPFQRRSILLFSLAGLAVREVLLWLLIPVVVAGMLAFDVIAAVAMFVVEIPRTFAAETRSTVRQWRRHLEGARRIWKAAKQ